MEDRCAGWETGKCPGAGKDETVERSCGACGEAMVASTEALMDEVMDSHAPLCTAGKKEEAGATAGAAAEEGEGKKN
jgi:hypothetical protein